MERDEFRVCFGISVPNICAAKLRTRPGTRARVEPHSCLGNVFGIVTLSSKEDHIHHKSTPEGNSAIVQS
eukprot:5618566-Amphidinium_carterae.1